LQGFIAYLKLFFYLGIVMKRTLSKQISTSFFPLPGLMTTNCSIIIRVQFKLSHGGFLIPLRFIQN